jgi:lipid II isoglutaminyl synthase (glutamine-hydrolysing)
MGTPPMLTLAHLYPREMNIYGDTGNVLVLSKRLQWRGLPFTVVAINPGDDIPQDVDILVGGGGQDAAQGDLGQDFVRRSATLRALADDGVVMLAICGTYQLLGHEFLTKDGVRIPGAGILDITTRGSDQRLIGNNSVDSPWGSLVGFENHSGLTDLGAGVQPIGRTANGRGNNGADGSEGATRDNVFGTYLHGPVLAKGPGFADEILRRALSRRGWAGELSSLDDSMALAAAKVASGRPR